MHSDKALTRLRISSAKVHNISETNVTFGYGELSYVPDALAAYMRVAADMVQNHIEVDVASALKNQCFYYMDEEESVVAFVLGHYCPNDQILSVVFGWTSPTLRRLGLFTNLMSEIIRCHWESGSINSLRVSPPFDDMAFDKAVSKLGFKPISRILEYHPHS